MTHTSSVADVIACLHALVDDEMAGIEEGELQDRWCVYCAWCVAAEEDQTIRHEAECPIAKARLILDSERG